MSAPLRWWLTEYADFGSTLAAAESAAIVSYYNAGGLVMIVNDGCCNDIGVTNALMAAMGSSITMIASPVDPGCMVTTEIESADCYMTGIASIGYAYFGRVEGGGTLFGSENLADPDDIAQVDPVTRRLVVLGDINVFQSCNNGAETIFGENLFSCLAVSPTPTPSPSPSMTATGTPSNTPSTTATNTPSTTATNTPSTTATNTPSTTATNTPSTTATNTPSTTATNTPSMTPSNTPSTTATNTPSTTATNTPSMTATNTPSTTATNTPSMTATNTPSTTATNTPSMTATNTASATATNTASTTATNTPTLSRSSTPSSSLTSSAAASTSPSASGSVSPTVSTSAAGSRVPAGSGGLYTWLFFGVFVFVVAVGFGAVLVFIAA